MFEDAIEDTIEDTIEDIVENKITLTNTQKKFNKTPTDFDKLCHEYIAKLYDGVTGFIAYSPSEKASYEKKNIYLTYGEILPQSVDKIIKYIDINEQDVFYDLGSGIGKVPLHFFLKSPIKKAHGIEASDVRDNIAKSVYANVMSEFSELFEGGRQLVTECGNFLEANLEDATIIYCCSTCFSTSLLAEMGQLVYRCPKLRYLISMKPIPCNLAFENIIEVDCTWDKTKCHIYSLVPKEERVYSLVPKEERA